MSAWLFLKRTLFVGRNVSVGRNFHIGLFSWLSSSEHLTIGDDVYIGKSCSIQCNGSIGDGVLIANNVGIVGRIDHDYRMLGVLVRNAPHISQSRAIRQHPKSRIDVGSDVWIGFGAVILTGIEIGRGAIVAAGAVVTTSVAPYDIVAGNPAQPVGRRFSDDQIATHEALLMASRPSDPSRRPHEPA